MPIGPGQLKHCEAPGGLRYWTIDDLVPRPGDVYQERLYCIRWIDAEGKRRYAAPDAADLVREARVLELLRERFAKWQLEGFIPSKAIPEGGDKTEEPTRTRGWTHWHHLFTPRQLLMHGLLGESMTTDVRDLEVARMLATGRLANWNSRLTGWSPAKGDEKGNQVFNNQALNTLSNYSTRPLLKLDTTWLLFARGFTETPFKSGDVLTGDARDLLVERDIWITDPPYADAVKYHELGD